MNYYDVDSVLIFMYGISVLLVIAEQYMLRWKIECAVVFFCVGLVSITALRPPADTLDTGIYIDLFESVPTFYWFFSDAQSFFDLPVEWGYLLLNLFLGNLMDVYEILFFIVASISISAYFLVFRRFSPYPALSLFIYMTVLFIFREYTQIRQGVACALALYSVRYVYEQQFKKFLFIIIIAASFHLSALFALSFYFINKISWSRRKIFFVVVMAIALTEIQWIYHVLEFFSDAGMLYYRVAKYQGDTVAQQSVTIWKYLVYVVLLAILGLIQWGERKRGEWINLLLGIFVGGIMIQGIFFEFKELADRISSLYYVVLFLLIPSYLEQSRYRTTFLFIMLTTLPFYFFRLLNWIKNPLQ